MAYEPKGKLTNIPTKEISVAWLKKQSQKIRDELIEKSLDVLWVLDVEPSTDVGQFDKPDRKNNPGVQALKNLRISHKQFQGDLFAHEPKVEDVIQENIGDCWWLASICSVLNHPVGKELVQYMIRDIGGGWVVVRLYEKQKTTSGTKTVTKYVPRFIKMKKTMITHTPIFKIGKTIKTLHSGGANWVAMLEKALTTFNCDERVFRPDDASYTKIIGGKSSDGMQLLAGVGSAFKDVVSTSKTDNEFSKMELFLELPDLLYSSLNDLDTMLGAPSFTLGQTGPLTIRQMCQEILTYCGNLSHYRSNITEYNREFMTLMRDYITQAHGVKLKDKLNKVYDHKSVHKLKEKGKEIKVSGEFRLEDLCDFLENKKSVWPPGEDCDISAMDMRLRVALIGWATASQVLPGKRGTMRYSNQQLAMFNEVAGYLGKGQLVCFGTREYVGRGSDSAGHSGGEKISKGLAGRHAYAVLDTLSKEGKKFFLVCNPWMQIGRGYAGEMFDGKQVQIKPTVRGMVQQKAGKGAFEIESGIFWFELADFTKRVDRLYLSLDAPRVPELERKRLRQEHTSKRDDVLTAKKEYNYLRDQLKKLGD